MKNLIYLITVVLMSGLFFTCDKNEGAYFPEPSALLVNPTTTQSINKDGGSIEITISGGNLGWWIESSQPWCTASQKYGSGDRKVTLVIDKNNTETSRNAEVIIHPTFKLEPVKIIINQQ